MSSLENGMPREKYLKIKFRIKIQYFFNIKDPFFKHGAFCFSFLDMETFNFKIFTTVF